MVRKLHSTTVREVNKKKIIIKKKKKKKKKKKTKICSHVYQHVDRFGC